MGEVKKYPISVIVITKNEERRLPDCLESVKWAQQIIVLDDESTDRTIDVARSYGADVFERKMENEGHHRNFASEQATQPWVLSLDADERISPELAADIQRFLTEDPDSSHVCMAVAMRNFIGDLWIEGAGYYPAYRTKIFRRGKLTYKDEEVHPPVSYEGTCGRLKGDIIHYTSPSFESWVAKFNRETSLESKKWIKKGREVKAISAWRKGTSRFLKFYFQKGGIKCGFQGFIMSVFHALYQWVTYFKYCEDKRTGKWDKKC